VPAAEPSLPETPPLEELPPAVNAGAIGAAAESIALLSTEEIVTRSMPAVVTVETRDGLGSGFFVATDTVATNAHVVAGSSAVTLKRSGGYSRAARVETRSHDIDLAVLKVDVADPDQIALPMALQSDVHIGGEVVAIGSPLGLANTVTRGIVSGMREIDGVRVIQTDTAINPGNSGGPLLDRYGRVLGVNTMKLGRGVEAIGFAVSIHYARAMLGAGFAPTSDGDRRREDALREYAENVRILARHADAVDANWKKFRTSCEAADAAPAADREWLALADGAQPPIRASASCRSWLEYFKDSAVRTRGALERYAVAARAGGVGTDRMRVLRRRHALASE
jgi:hypothetical protein